MQCSGAKDWFVRPVGDLQLWSAAGYHYPSLEKSVEGHRRLKIHCEEGDMLIVNTRLWWHETQFDAAGSPSMSIARDFSWVNDTAASDAKKAVATEPWDEGALIFREKPLLAVQSSSNKQQYLCCERCTVPIGSPALHLALLLGEVSRKDVEKGNGADYEDWATPDVRGQHASRSPGIPGLPPVREIVHGARGRLFCSTVCAQKGRAEASEIPGFNYLAWDLTNEAAVGAPAFLGVYVEHLTESLRLCDAYDSTAVVACEALGGSVALVERNSSGALTEVGKQRLCEMLAKLAADLKRCAPTWRGRVLHANLSTVQAGLKWPKPNVEVVFTYDLEACLQATRQISVGDYFNLALSSSTWLDIENEEQQDEEEFEEDTEEDTDGVK
eukprot:gnl/TRDRNA2_/TRDRNA2_169991_c5_seq4.p1 gnl/TRDRNA2_/TRDRNA2_169991_c5~~gnl/TRDRNA2_/TRDRNA2_169991_c5_seq4.p1  ORF type:complete len:385 (+),score=63.08 gnl/TRDRNA2_/TRDRNA2_169991_c5_seq4:295-1449(+)